MTAPASLLTPILTSAEMRACDEHTMTVDGVPSQVLMERAARAVAAFLLDRTDLFPRGRVVVLCGGGNNGGDGLAAARFLANGSMGETREVDILYVGKCLEDGQPDEGRMSVACAHQYRLAQKAGIPIRTATSPDAALDGAEVVIDAVFGIGLDRPIAGTIATVLDAVAEAVIRRGLPVLAVDIPSGVNADTGALAVTPPMRIPQARATVTMQALKAGLLFYPGAALCGEVAVADIGIGMAVSPRVHMADEALLGRVLPARERRSHKGTYGRVLLLCGSVGMSGAAVLSARAALRSGAGLVEVLTPEENRVVLQTAVPEAIVTPYDAAVPGLCANSPTFAERRATFRTVLQTSVSAADVIVAGCGLGRSEASRLALRTVLDAVPTGRCVPLVLDADALNLLGEDPTLWDTAALSDPSPNRCVVVTPHPAEMARLWNGLENTDLGGESGGTVSVAQVLEKLSDTAKVYAAERGITVVLKDAHTVVASPDGMLLICAAGNAGMAKGGSGDALAGVIGALLAAARSYLGDSLSAAEVAGAGVYLHAAAGDAAAAQLGEYGMLTTDLIEHLPIVTKGLSDSRTRLGSVRSQRDLR